MPISVDADAPLDICLSSLRGKTWYSEQEVNDLLAGITDGSVQLPPSDVYTKGEVRDLIAAAIAALPQPAPPVDAYSRKEVDDKLAALPKPAAVDAYTRKETDDKLKAALADVPHMWVPRADGSWPKPPADGRLTIYSGGAVGPGDPAIINGDLWVS